MNSYSRTSTIKTIERLSGTIFWTLAIAIVLMSSAYAYFIAKTVWNVAERGHIQSEMIAMSSKLGDIEFKYMNSVGSITMDSAVELGFHSASDKTIFVSKERIGKNVAIR